MATILISWPFSLQCSISSWRFRCGVAVIALRIFFCCEHFAVGPMRLWPLAVLVVKRADEWFLESGNKKANKENPYKNCQMDGYSIFTKGFSVPTDTRVNVLLTLNFGIEWRLHRSNLSYTNTTIMCKLRTVHLYRTHTIDQSVCGNDDDERSCLYRNEFTHTANVLWISGQRSWGVCICQNERSDRMKHVCVAGRPNWNKYNQINDNINDIRFETRMKLFFSSVFLSFYHFFLCDGKIISLSLYSIF